MLPARLLRPVDRGSDVPVGAQLAARFRAAVATGTLQPGERLPSVRDLAEAAGVNVNTARAAYGRLEAEGFVRSEHGRGTFVAGAAAQRAEASTRRELRRQIAELEAELAQRAPRPAGADPFAEAVRSAGARLPSTAELAGIRDDLLTRLQELDAERGELLRRLAELDLAEGVTAAEPQSARRSTLSLRGARVRWVGV
jgi:GntR family transcriptional regulator